MADALLDLERVLHSKKEPLSPQEANILISWKEKAMRGFTLGFGGGSLAAWLGTRKLSNLLRSNIVLGTAAVCGLWGFNRSIESTVDHILSVNGTKMQPEFATILLKRYHNDPWVVQRLSKYFYMEEVFDDIVVDKATLRWRFRNSFSDYGVHYGSASYGEETNKQNISFKTTTTTTKTTTPPKQANVHAVNMAVENPFELVFGSFGSSESDSDSTTPKVTSRRKARREKQARRRRMRHHQEESGV